MPRQPSKLEHQFSIALRAHGKDLPPHETEVRFTPPRLFRWDFAWVDQKVAVEIEGGIYQAKGGHTNVNGYNANCEKHNLGELNGWRLLRFTERMLSNDPEQCVRFVRELLQNSAPTT